MSIMIRRLRAAIVAFRHPEVIEINYDLLALVMEIYMWTNYKRTAWAVAAKRAIDRFTELQGERI